MVCMITVNDLSVFDMSFFIFKLLLFFYFKLDEVPFRVQQLHMRLQLSSGENDVFHIK